jgi:hypothetical protein
MAEGQTKLIIDPLVTFCAWWVGEIKAEVFFEPATRGRIASRRGKDKSRVDLLLTVNLSNVEPIRPLRP